MNTRNSKHWNVLLWLAVTMFLTLPLSAKEASSTFSDANKLYEQGKFHEAIAGYEKTLQSGIVTTPVLFNLGNAFLKSGQIGQAIGAYRRAEKLSPRDPDVQANLQFARNQAGGGSTHPTPLWIKISGKLTLNEWAISASIALSVWFVLLAVRQWGQNYRKSFRGILFALGILWMLLALGLASAIQRELFSNSAIVIVPEAVVRRGPFEESQSAFALRDGAEVSVLDKNNGWLEIVDAAQRKGWLPKTDVLFIHQSKR